jgi:hypothetical protein
VFDVVLVGGHYECVVCSLPYLYCNEVEGRGKCGESVLFCVNLLQLLKNECNRMLKYNILYILMFMFLDSRREDKNSGLNGSKHYPNSISS